MANVRNGNTWYIDSTGDLGATTSYQAVNVLSVTLTLTASGARIVLQDKSTSANKIDIRSNDSTSQLFDYMANPLYFPNGIKVSTLTNAIATVVIKEQGG